MFLARRPTRNVIGRFLRESQDLPLSYGPIGIARTPRFDVFTCGLAAQTAAVWKRVSRAQAPSAE